MSSPVEGYMFDVRPKRVSLVKRPANKREFLVTKHQEDSPMDEVIQVITETQAENEESLVEALKSADKDAGTTQAAVAVSRILAAFRDSFTESDLDEIAKSLSFKTVEDEVSTEKEEEEVEEEVAEEEVVEEAPADAEPVAVEAVKDEAEEVVEEPVKEVNEDLETLKAEVEELKQERALAKYREMVSDLSLTRTPHEIAPILKAVAESAGEEALEETLEMLRAASNVAKIAFEEVGSAAPGRVYNADAWGRIDEEAKSIMKSEGVAYHKAVELVVDRNPELGREYYK